MGTFVDLTGQKFNKLTVMYRAENHISKSGRQRIQWHCKCECGNEIDVYALNLTRNHTTSCGCSHITENNKRREDLTGKSYNMLTAISYIEGSSPARWLCQCQCGNTIEVYATNLKSGKTKSCGCKRPSAESPKRMGSTIDLTGHQKGMLTAVERLDDGVGPIRYRCACECGNEIIVSHESLSRKGERGANSCGCLKKTKGKKLDLLGQKFNMLTVISRADSRYNKVHWLCKCDCGNTVIVSSSGLTSGHTKSCGCYQDQTASDTHFIDLTGKKFGLWTLLKRAENTSLGTVQYLCKCKCGNIRTVASGNLTSGLSYSCGCYKRSILETLVVELFTELGFSEGKEYESQKRYDDLRGIGQGMLSYDFALTLKDKLYLIECQGLQHYKPVEIFGGEHQFEVQQLHDELKREYAESIGAQFVEIPYIIRTKQGIKGFLIENHIELSE